MVEILSLAVKKDFFKFKELIQFQPVFIQTNHNSKRKIKVLLSHHPKRVILHVKVEITLELADIKYQLYGIGLHEWVRLILLYII